MPRSRRDLLGSIGGTLLIGSSGCVSNDQPKDLPRASPTDGTVERRDATSTTRTPTGESDGLTPLRNPGSPSNLRLTATARSRVTDGDPARIEAAVENTDDRPIEVRFGPTLLYTDNSEDFLEWADEIVLDPDTYIGPWAEPFETDDGCWRYPADGEILTQSIAERYRFEPGDSYSERYDVLTIGEDVPCLPDGTYRFQDLGYTAGEDSVDLLFTVDVTIDTQGAVSAEARIVAGEDVGS